MTGIVETPSKKFYTVEATHTIAKRTHHFAVALKSCCKTARSFDRIYTFNPFVVGSTPARPTIKLNEIKHLQRCKCFFFAPKSATHRLRTFTRFFLVQNVLFT